MTLEESAEIIDETLRDERMIEIRIIFDDPFDTRGGPHFIASVDESFFDVEMPLAIRNKETGYVEAFSTEELLEKLAQLFEETKENEV
jgi:uncharacterized protein YqkB